MSKEVGVGGRLDIFLDSGWMLYISLFALCFAHCSGSLSTLVDVQ